MTAPALEHYPKYGTFVWMDEQLVRVDTTVLEVRSAMRDMNYGLGLSSTFTLDSLGGYAGNGHD